jgi:hypothetical protein
MWPLNNRRVLELPEELSHLVSQAESNHDKSAAYRRAMAELEARTAWSLSQSTKQLSTATWILAACTAILCIVTLLKR